MTPPKNVMLLLSISIIYVIIYGQIGQIGGYRLMQPQCEGEVSQVLPSSCCQTLQPALLPIDLTVQCKLYTQLIYHFWLVLSGQFLNMYIYYL